MLDYSHLITVLTLRDLILYNWLLISGNACNPVIVELTFLHDVEQQFRLVNHSERAAYYCFAAFMDRRAIPNGFRNKLILKYLGVPGHLCKDYSIAG